MKSWKFQGVSGVFERESGDYLVDVFIDDASYPVRAQYFDFVSVPLQQCDHLVR